MSPKFKRLLRNFLLEILIYSILLVLYFFIVLRFLGEPLNNLFHLNLWVYAPITLLLIVVQSVLLEMVTSFLIDRLGFEKME